MKCEELKSRLADLLCGELESRDKESCDKHLASCVSCAEEVRILSETWTRLGVLPLEQPSPALRQRFYGMLEAYRHGLLREGSGRSLGRAVGDFFTRLWPRQPAFQFGLAMLFLIIGMGAGFFLHRSGEVSPGGTGLQSDALSRRQMTIVSLLQESSASERLRGVSLSRGVEKPGEMLLSSLLSTLNTDPNVNVRLAAVDALYLFTDIPEVKNEVVRSLEQQESPLVQAALIDLLVSLKEQRALRALRQLVQDEKLNPFVREKAALGIQQLSY